MNPRRPTSFPVTVTRLPTVRCDVCDHVVAHRPGQAASTLTDHYRDRHPDHLTPPGPRAAH